MMYRTWGIVNVDCVSVGSTKCRSLLCLLLLVLKRPVSAGRLLHRPFGHGDKLYCTYRSELSALRKHIRAVGCFLLWRLVVSCSLLHKEKAFERSVILPSSPDFSCVENSVMRERRKRCPQRSGWTALCFELLLFVCLMGDTSVSLALCSPVV